MPLSEYQQGGRGFGPDEAQQAAGVNSQEQECSTLGPLPNRAQAAELSSELARLGIPSRLRLETLTSITDYWVIQTPEVTADNQQSDIARLRRAGIRDISPIREGEHSGGISLGIYSDRTDAIERRQQVDAAELVLQPGRRLYTRCRVKKVRAGRMHRATSGPQLLRQAAQLVLAAPDERTFCRRERAGLHSG